MPGEETLKLQAVHCRRDECRRILARVRLQGSSQVEIKCPRCKAISIFAAESATYKLRPDGQGGYLTVPLSDNIA